MSESRLCERCGAFGDMPHGWVEGDCVLPHKGHSTRLADGALICFGCLDRHRAWLREILELYVHLADVIPLGSIPDDTADHGKPRKQPASPAPFRLAAWAMLFDNARLYRTGSPADLPDVPAVLNDLALRALEDQGLAGASLNGTVSTATLILIEHAAAVARMPWVDEYDAELAWVRKHLRHAHGISARRPVGRCPSLDGDGAQCGGPLWPATDGAMAVDCGHCGRHYDEVFLRHLGGMMAAGDTPA